MLRGGVLCIVGCLAASLISHFPYPVLPNKNIGKHCQMSRRGSRQCAPGREAVHKLVFPTLLPLCSHTHTHTHTYTYTLCLLTRTNPIIIFHVRTNTQINLLKNIHYPENLLFRLINYDHTSRLTAIDKIHSFPSTTQQCYQPFQAGPLKMDGSQ